MRLVLTNLTYDEVKPRIRDLVDALFYRVPAGVGSTGFVRLSHDEFLQLGVNPSAPRAGFNMTVMALKLSAFRNGVSRRHGEVSRKMWQCLWPGKAAEKVPIDSITNGIHVPTWIEPKMQLLFNRYLGEDWLANHDDPAVWQKIDAVSASVIGVSCCRTVLFA